MSASVNKVIIVGNLGRDPETRAFPSGDQVCNIRVATTDKWRDKQSGEPREHTEWHSIVFGGKLAEIASQYLRKGSSVYIEGRLRTRKWTDQSGNERYSTEVRAETMQMLGSRQGVGQAGHDGGQGGYDQGQYGGYDSQPQQRQKPQQRQQSQGQGYQQPPRNQGGYAPQGQATQQGYQQAPQQGYQQAPQGQQAPQWRPASGFDDMDDDIPF